MSATSTSILTVSAQAALKATTSYLNAQVSTVLGGAPSSLDTISELAAALNNAYNFAGSITGVLGTKAAAADVDSISSTLALKANQVDYTSLSSVVVNKANTVSADTVGAAVVALNNTATTLVADVATLKAGGGNIDSNAVSVGGVTLGDLVNWTKEIYVKIGSTNADGTINEKLNRLANPTNVSNVLSFEYDANGAVSKVSQLVTLKFDKSQTRVSVTGGVGNPTVSMSNLVLDSNNNYLFTFPYVGNAEYYTTNKTAVVITALDSQYMLAPAVPTVSLSALDVSSSNYKNATPTITTPYAATTWDDGAEIITQPVTIQTESGSVLKFDTGTYTGVTIEVGSGATLVSNKTFSTTGASSTYLVKYAPSIVNNVGAISVSVMGSSSKLPSDTSTIANVFNDYAQYATPTLVSGSKIVSRSGSTYTLTASFDSVSMYGLYNASNQNVTNEVGHPNAFVLRKSTADWRPLMRQQNPYRSEIGAFSSNYDDPQQTYQPWSPDSQFNTSYSGNEIAKKFAYYASYWLTRLKIPTDQYLSVPVYTGRNYSSLFFGSTIYYNASDVFAGYLTFGMEGSTLVCRLSGYNSGTKYTFTVQSDAVATATAENNADAGTLRISNGLPNLMVVRTADTWKDKVPLITASLANAQSWGGVNGGYDIQFYDVTYSSSNQVAVQFAYFAQYWLNRLNVPVGKAMSVPVIAAQGAVGIFSFWKITSSTYGGNLSTFSSNNYEFQVQADAIAAGIAAQVKYVASVTYLAASFDQPVLKVRVPTAGALRASNYLTINGEGLAAHAAPMLSGSVAYSGSAGAYIATSTHTFNANVSAIKVMKSDGTTIIASQAVSSGTATIVISYTTADISGSKSFHVVALGNDFGTDSLASVSQMLVDPPPLSNFTVGAKALADGAFAITAPTSTVATTYATNALKPTILFNGITNTDNWGYASTANGAISGDGTIIAVMSSIATSGATLQMYKYNSTPSTYVMNTMTLNGTTNGIQLSDTAYGNVIGLVSGKKGTISMWWNLTAASSGSQMLWVSRNTSSNEDMVSLIRLHAGSIYFRAGNVTTNVIIATTSNAVCASAGMYHIFVSWDTGVLNRVNILINGVQQTLTMDGFILNSTIEYGAQNHGIGGNLYSPFPNFSPTTPGMVGQVYVNYVEYVDPSNIGKFYGGANTPVGLGENGNVPTGSIPTFYIEYSPVCGLVNLGSSLIRFLPYGSLVAGTIYNGTGAGFGNYWSQLGGSIVGTGLLGMVKNTVYPSCISMSANGKLICVGQEYNQMTILKFDDTKTIAPAKWIVSQLNLTTSGLKVVLSGDGNTFVVGNQVFSTTDGGTTWTQKGQNLNGTLVSTSISANGLTIVALLDVSYVITVYTWYSSSWVSSTPIGSGGLVAISGDGNIINKLEYRNVKRYSLNAGAWTYVGTSVSYSELEGARHMSTSFDGSFTTCTCQTNSGELRLFRWNGSSNVLLMDQRVISNRTNHASNYYPFVSTLSYAGRFIVGGLTTIGVYDIISNGAITYTSSNPSVADLYGNGVFMKAVGTSTITASQTTATGTGTITDVLTVIPQFATPVLSNKVFALTATPDAYTFTATVTVEAAVTQIKIVKLGAADTIHSVTGGSVAISVPYATADLYTSFYVVALTNGVIGSQSNPVSQLFTL
jgi:hypothetical protein